MRQGHLFRNAGLGKGPTLMSGKLTSLPALLPSPCLRFHLVAFSMPPLPSVLHLGAAPQRNFPTPGPEAVYETDCITKPSTE